eukprot:CAMPEP_0184688024 /NCGR_PEP_ID=MMETSP0312-20130426/28317_1 /TAXON_ID=31354 /ORGANISM="Compsopogon coeruleus, Strain SAG 36.94" /LENGTH=180 /DNA_ID=CAMNT_0027144725 /DNA_START=337 /DNA_END=879 /DNA_ORIENTATION=-
MAFLGPRIEILFSRGKSSPGLKRVSPGPLARPTRNPSPVRITAVLDASHAETLLMPVSLESIQSAAPWFSHASFLLLAGLDGHGPPWLPLAQLLAGPGLAIYNFLLIVRIVLTWYPKADLDKLPLKLAVVPTEFLLAPTRKVFPPEGGVDVSPIVWFAILSLTRELLVGQQGFLVLLSGN